jgi:hypothetical protein
MYIHMLYKYGREIVSFTDRLGKREVCRGRKKRVIKTNKHITLPHCAIPQGKRQHYLPPYLREIQLQPRKLSHTKDQGDVSLTYLKPH